MPSSTTPGLLTSTDINHGDTTNMTDTTTTTETTNKTDPRIARRLTLEQGLPQFIGTEQWYRRFGNLIYTDGVRFLAETAQSYWLLDLVASYQPTLARKTSAFGGTGIPFQLWTLTVDLDHTSAVVTCQEDDGAEAIVRQEIEYTDFPLPELTLYCEQSDGHRFLMLPGER